MKTTISIPSTEKWSVYLPRLSLLASHIQLPQQHTPLLQQQELRPFPQHHELRPFPQHHELRPFPHPQIVPYRSSHLLFFLQQGHKHFQQPLQQLNPFLQQQQWWISQLQEQESENQ
jgi:hypothetical protein